MSIKTEAVQHAGKESQLWSQAAGVCQSHGNVTLDKVVSIAMLYLKCGITVCCLSTYTAC